MEGNEHEAPVTPQETPTSGASERPSLTERLMNPQLAASARPAQDGSGREEDAATSGGSSVGSARRPDTADASTRQRMAFNGMARSNAAADNALTEARRFVRLRYFGFLLSMLILLATLVVAVIVLGVSLLTDATWKEQAASGGVAGGALLLLLFLQYRPAGSFASAAVEIAQLEALRNHLEKSYALWDGFLEVRESQQQVAANEVALAVSSMTATTRELIATQAQLAAGRGSSRGSNAAKQALPPSLSVTQPDPRRY